MLRLINVQSSCCYTSTQDMKCTYYSPTLAGHTPSRQYRKFRRNTWIHLTRPILGFFFFWARYFHITIVLTLKVPLSFPRPRSRWVVVLWSYGASFLSPTMEEVREREKEVAWVWPIRWVEPQIKLTLTLTLIDI